MIKATKLATTQKSVTNVHNSPCTNTRLCKFHTMRWRMQHIKNNIRGSRVWLYELYIKNKRHLRSTNPHSRVYVLPTVHVIHYSLLRVLQGCSRWRPGSPIRWLISNGPRTQQRLCTHNSVVLAAESTGAAGAASSREGDWGAAKSEDNVRALHDNFELVEEIFTSRRASL